MNKKDTQALLSELEHAIDGLLDIVEKYCPNYYTSDFIAHCDDLSCVLAGEKNLKEIQ